MKKQPWAGLVIAGEANRTSIGKLPGLSAGLGPVKAPSLRAGSRISNTLRAGYPVETYGQLQEARLVLICVPERDLADTVHALSLAGLDWSGKSAAVYDSPQDRSVLSPLSLLGAATGSMNAVQGLEAAWVAEGDPAALRELKRLGSSRGTRVLELAPGTKQLYLAALAFSNPLFLPLVAAVTDCLRGTGLHMNEVRQIARHLFEDALRAWFKAGKKAWTAKDARELTQMFKSLDKDNPMLGYLYDRLNDRTPNKQVH